MGAPSILLPNSAAAISAATTSPFPPMSEYSPDMSSSTPILTTPPEIFPFACAHAPVATSNRRMPANATMTFPFI
jgi:hypothetical protein